MAGGGFRCNGLFLLLSSCGTSRDWAQSVRHQIGVESRQGDGMDAPKSETIRTRKNTEI
jgi:hypothetical protein